MSTGIHMSLKKKNIKKHWELNHGHGGVQSGGEWGKELRIEFPQRDVEHVGLSILGGYLGINPTIVEV